METTRLVRALLILLRRVKGWYPIAEGAIFVDGFRRARVPERRVNMREAYIPL
jgi:hypothetical protein